MRLATQLETSFLLQGSNRELSHARGEPGPPTPGFTMKVHDCDNEHNIAPDLINNSERKLLVRQRRVRLEMGAQASGY